MNEIFSNGTKSNRQSCYQSLKSGFQYFSTLIFSSCPTCPELSFPVFRYEERTTTLHKRSNKHVKNISPITIISLEKSQHGSKRHCEGTLERSLCLVGFFFLSHLTYIIIIPYVLNFSRIISNCKQDLLH